MAFDYALHEWAPTVACIAQTLTSCLVSEICQFTQLGKMLTWRKMTVAVCLVVALRTIDLRWTDMTEKEGLQEHGATFAIVPLARGNYRPASELCESALSQLQSQYVSQPDNNGK
jgi:hypothetical protein